MPVVAAMGGRSARALGLGGNGYLPQTNALIARMSPKPLPARESVINRLIATLIGAGVWTKLDVLQVYAADAQANALLNWIGNSYNASVVNTPTFTTDRGIAGVSGTTSYLRSGYTPSTGPKWGTNDHSFGRWLRTGADGGAYDMGAYENATLKSATILSNATAPQYQVIDAGDIGTVNSSPVGSVTVNRSSSGSYDIYKDGSFVSNVTSASRAGVPLELFVCAYNFDGTPATISANQIGAIWIGQSLTSAEVLALHNALQAYMTGVGA